MSQKKKPDIFFLFFFKKSDFFERVVFLYPPPAAAGGGKKMALCKKNMWLVEKSGRSYSKKKTPDFSRYAWGDVSWREH